MTYRLTQVAELDLVEIHKFIAKGLRSYPTGNYIIFYHVSESFVIIDRILHSARDIDSFFNSN